MTTMKTPNIGKPLEVGSVGSLSDVLKRMTRLANRIRPVDKPLAIELQQEIDTLRRAFLPTEEPPAEVKRGCC